MCESHVGRPHGDICGRASFCLPSGQSGKQTFLLAHRQAGLGAGGGWGGGCVSVLGPTLSPLRLKLIMFRSAPALASLALASPGWEH